MTIKQVSIKATAKTEGVTTPMSKVAEAMDKARKKTEAMSDGMSKSAKVADKFGKIVGGALERVGHHLTDLAIQAPAALLAFSQSMVASARHAEQLAQKVGGSTQEIQALISAGQRLRIDTDVTSEAIKTLQENLGELERLGTGPARDSLGSLGLTLQDFAGLGIEDRMKVFAEALKNLESPTKQLSIAMEVMGNDGGELLPLMLKGASGIDELTEAARRSGQVLSDDAIAATRELDLTVADMQAQVEGAAKTFMVSLLPIVQDAADGMQSFIAENRDFIEQDLPGVAYAVADAMKVAADMIIVVAEAINRARRNAEYFGDLAADIVHGEEGPRTDTRGVDTFVGGESTGNAERRITAAQLAKKEAADQAARDRADRIFDEEMAGVAREIQAENAARFEASERGDLTRKKGGKKKKGRKSFHFGDDPTALRDKAFQHFQQQEREQAAMMDPFSEANMAIQNENLERQRTFEQTRAEITLAGRLRSIEMLQESGADPMMLIDAEEQAKIQFLEGELQRSSGKIEQMQIEGRIAETHHAATMKRIAAEDAARRKQAALIKMHTDFAIDQMSAFGGVALTAALTSGQSVKESVAAFAKQHAIMMAITATSEAVKGAVALAGIVTAPLAPAHFAAAAQAGAAAVAFGALAGATGGFSDLGGGGGKGGGISAGGSGFGGGGIGGNAGTSSQQRSTPSAPISRPGGGASATVQGQNGNHSTRAGGMTVINMTQNSLGFTTKEETIAEVRRMIRRSEETQGAI